MKKHIPNLLTCMNLLVGAVGILYVLSGEETPVIYFVALAGLFDLLDGFIARLLNVQSAIGKQLDSLADLISFGLLPSFFMLKWIQASSEFYWIALIIAVFSAVRLANFNVDESQSDSFKGLPTPANALMLTSLVLIPFELHVYTLISICVFSSIMLVSPLRLIALKFSSYGWKGNEERWLLLIGVIGMLAVFQETSIPFIIPFYILISLVSNLIKASE